MKLGPLKVLHLQNFKNKEGMENPLIEFRKQVDHFAPMTCARQVYIFFDLKQYDLSQTLPYLEANSSKCEFLTGLNAYAFLLKWAAGIESHKLQQNDHFVLGALRHHWGEFCFNYSTESKLYNVIMSMLFQDASNIRKLTQEELRKKAITTEGVAQMCQNCALSRMEGAIPSYDALNQAAEHYREIATQKKIETISLLLQKLNIKGTEDNLTPSLRDNEQIANFKILERCLKLSREKSQLKFNFVEPEAETKAQAQAQAEMEDGTKQCFLLEKVEDTVGEEMFECDGTAKIKPLR